jgi:hypothetical protein
MKETFDEQQQAIDRIAEIDKLMGFPDDTGTLTYAIPQQDEEGVWWIEVGSDVKEKEVKDEPIQ